VNPTAAAGFGLGRAARYDAARPTYPPAAVDRLVAALGVGPTSVVVDVAAGTGKLTHLLPGRVVAVEPIGDMRRHLRVPCAAGMAEALPLRSGSADAVTVAQAFHWFDEAAAAAEIHRLLRPGGGLARLWNQRDDRVDWVAELDGIIHAHDDGAYGPPPADRSLPGFGPVERFVCSFAQPQTVDGVVARALSTSYIASRPEVHARVERDVRALLALPKPPRAPAAPDTATPRVRHPPRPPRA
jgi:SAM-dependent methyltransferase